MKPRQVPVVVGIGGGTGAGKTRLARILCERYADVGVSILDMDSYYLDRRHLPEEARRAVNYDEPAAIDHDLLGRHLAELVRGRAVEKPRYCFATHTRSPEVEVVTPATLVVLEGIFALWEPRVRALLALKVFLDADPDVRFIQRLRRDIVERGRSVESVVTQYLHSVRPMHRLHVEPTRTYADLALSGESIDADAFRVIERIDDLLGARIR